MNRNGTIVIDNYDMVGVQELNVNALKTLVENKSNTDQCKIVKYITYLCLTITYYVLFKKINLIQTDLQSQSPLEKKIGKF